MSKISETKKKGNKVRASSGLLVSLSNIIKVISAVFIVGLAIYSGSYIVSGFVVVVLIIPAIKRFTRSKSQLPLSMQGDGTSDDYSVKNGIIEVKEGGNIWSKPLSDYEGVLRTKRTSSMGRKSPNTTRQIIELRHSKDRAFDVNIYTSREDVGVRARWEEAAQKFNLPALRDLGDGNILRRETGDIGKSLQELANEDGLDVSFATNAPVPLGARWTNNGRVLEVHQRRAPWPCFLITIPFLLFYALVGYNLPFGILFGNNDAAMLPLLRVIVYIPAALIACVWIRISIQIRLTPSEVTVTGRLGPIPLWRQSLPLNEVEEVLVGPSLVVWNTVLIESIYTTLRVWPLSEINAQWLGQFLRSAIANAPDPDDDGRDAMTAVTGPHE